TFEFSATSGEPTNTNVTSAVVTSETSSVLDAKPSHGRQKPRRSASQIANAASAAPNVTQKPQTKTGICGYWISLYVGVMSSSSTAKMRTRATSHSPSTPAAASAGSGLYHGVMSAAGDTVRRSAAAVSGLFTASRTVCA